MPRKPRTPLILQMKKTMPKPDDFRTAFMRSLELKKQELQQTLDRLIKSRKEYEGELTAGDFIDEVDDAQREISAYSQFSLIERKNRELQQIEYLLNRVAEEKDFGLCEECGTRIPKERLLLVPEATLCVACQRELEKMDSRMSMASHSTGFSPTRREVSWETTEPAEEDDNLLVEYHIGTLSDVDMNETDAEAPPEDKEDKDALGYGGEQAPVRVGNEFRGAEFVHELLVDVHLHIGHAVPNLIHLVPFSQ